MLKVFVSISASGIVHRTVGILAGTVVAMYLTETYRNVVLSPNGHTFGV